ncbi:MAG: molybdenum cofactor biosynthesis protein MoaE [Verrucomicrobiales bacterium]|nr:molybdenum cofactor biosynthesis protein MoaE [Verrucomicrobiales bacterium]
MHRHLELTAAPIPLGDLAASRVESSTSGAVITFLGVVRGSEAGQPIAALDYEAFEPMARHQFEKLFQTMETRWPSLESTRLVHRYGIVPAGQPSLWVEVTAPHRGDAFAACQWLIDEMKRVVPIWKRTVPTP